MQSKGWISGRGIKATSEKVGQRQRSGKGSRQHLWGHTLVPKAFLKAFRGDRAWIPPGQMGTRMKGTSLVTPPKLPTLPPHRSAKMRVHTVTEQHHSPLLLLLLQHPSAAVGPQSPGITFVQGHLGAGKKPWGPRGTWVPEPVLRRGSGDRPPASASAPDVQENRENGAGSTPGLAALALSRASRQTWQTSHPSSASFSPTSEQPVAGETLS